MNNLFAICLKKTSTGNLCTNNTDWDKNAAHTKI